MITSTVLAYLAGAMDSDGYFTIKRSTYHRRVRGDAKNAVYSEKLGLHQTTPDIPHLLKECFGGSLYMATAASENRKPMWRYTATDKGAAMACKMLLPYLMVKKRQAQLLLELRGTKAHQFQQLPYWFKIDHPDWEQMELITVSETAALLGYTVSSVLQAIRKETILATNAKAWRREAPRVPLVFVQALIDNGGARIKPPQLIAWRERIHQAARELNKMGVNGTSVYFKTGKHTPTE